MFFVPNTRGLYAGFSEDRDETSNVTPRLVSATVTPGAIWARATAKRSRHGRGTEGGSNRARARDRRLDGVRSFAAAVAAAWPVDRGRRHLVPCGEPVLRFVFPLARAVRRLLPALFESARRRWPARPARRRRRRRTRENASRERRFAPTTHFGGGAGGAGGAGPYRRVRRSISIVRRPAAAIDARIEVKMRPAGTRGQGEEKNPFAICCACVHSPLLVSRFGRITKQRKRRPESKHEPRGHPPV